MRGFVAALVLIAAGVALAGAAGGRFALQVAGLVVAGIGAVVGVAAAFWVIGDSEDRERRRSGGTPDDPDRS
jgi:uncharacterized membrane protein YccC